HTSRNAGHTSTTSATTHATTSPATMPTSTASHHDVTTEAATNTDGASTAQHTTNATRANRAECRRWTTSTIADEPRPAPPRTVVPLDLNTSYLSLRSRERDQGADTGTGDRRQSIHGFRAHSPRP